METTQKGQQSNRKPVTKSLYQIVKNIDSCTEDELEHLKTNFKYDTSSAYLETLQSELLAKPDKPVFFEKPSFNIDTELLLKQFTLVEKNQKELLLHDFKKDSSPYRALYRWAGFQLSQDLFTFVHFQLYVKRVSTNNNNNNKEEEGRDLEEIRNMQLLLIESSTRPTKEKMKDVMLAMENLLDSNMTQIILHYTMAIFVFESNALEEGDFRILVAFQYHSQQLPSFLKTVKKPLVLSGEDLFDNFLGMEEESSDVMKIDGVDLVKLRLLLRDTSFSYLYYGFSRK